jgi:hypothetical protein
MIRTAPGQASHGTSCCRNLSLWLGGLFTSNIDPWQIFNFSQALLLLPIPMASRWWRSITGAGCSFPAGLTHFANPMTWEPLAHRSGLVVAASAGPQAVGINTSLALRG